VFYSEAQQLQLPYIQENIYPYEGAYGGKWKAITNIHVYNSDTGHTVLFLLKKGEIFTPVTGNVHIMNAGIFYVYENYGNYKKGQRVDVLSYRGEGFYDLWDHGKVCKDELPDFWISNPKGKTKGKLIKEPVTIWWVKIKTKSGKTGWIKPKDKFHYMEPEEVAAMNKPEQFLSLFKDISVKTFSIYPKAFDENNPLYAFKGRLMDSSYFSFLKSADGYKDVSLENTFACYKQKISADIYLLIFRQRADLFSYPLHAMLWDSKTQKVTDVLYMIANDESSAGFSSFITSTLKKDNRTKKLQLILKMKTIKPDRDVYEEGDVIYTETKSTWYYSFTGSKFDNLKTVWH
jgi:hypothetical protein